MEAGVSYNKQRLHKAGYFRQLLASNPDIDEGLGLLLRLCRETVVRLGKSALVRSRQRDSSLTDRVERLLTIPAVGPITALTWALEVGEVQRFSSIKKAVSYCGLCGAEKSCGNTVQRTPLSTAQQTFADHADRGGEDGAAQQCGTGHALRQGKTEGQCQPRDAGSGAQAGDLSHGGRSWAAEFSNRRDEKQHRCVGRGSEQGGFLRRVACQVSSLTRLGEGAQALDAPVDKFPDWQEGTHSIFCEDHSVV
jgi:hypothetical protein